MEPQYGTQRGTTAPGTTGTGTNAGSSANAGPVQEQEREGARAKIQQVASKARTQTSEKVRSGLDSGKSRAANRLTGVASALHESSGSLRDKDAQIAEYVDKLGSQVDRFVDYLQRTDSQELVREAERLARRQPALVLGGAFALGLIGARFMKASREHRNEREYAVGGDMERANLYGTTGYTTDAGTTAGSGMRGQESGLYDRERPMPEYREPDVARGIGTEGTTTGPSGTGTSSGIGGGRPATGSSTDPLKGPGGGGTPR